MLWGRSRGLRCRLLVPRLGGGAGGWRGRGGGLFGGRGFLGGGGIGGGLACGIGGFGELCSKVSLTLGSCDCSVRMAWDSWRGANGNGNGNAYFFQASESAGLASCLHLGDYCRAVGYLVYD